MLSDSNIKRGGKDDVPPDLALRVLHLLEQASVADDSGSVADLLAGLVETRDDANDGSLLDVGKLRDLLERLATRRDQRSTRHVQQVAKMEAYHPLRPLVHGLDQPELECNGKVVVRYPAAVLNATYPLGDVENDPLALKYMRAISNSRLRDRDAKATNLQQPWRQFRLDLSLLLEDEARKKGDDLLGLVRCEGVLQDELREDKFVRRVDLSKKRSSTLKFRTRVERNGPRKQLVL